MAEFVFDVETFYDSASGYTLKKMTTEEYINDPRFHLFGAGISKNGGPARWIPGEQLPRVLEALQLGKHTVICHNAPFDLAILNWRYNVQPGRIVDTLAMARGLLGNTSSLSLDALSTRFELGAKGLAVQNMDGIRHPDPEMLAALARYCENDVELTWKLYQRLKPAFPPAEHVIVDLTTRMFTEPSFYLDERAIAREIELADTRRETLLARAGCEIGDLRSDDKFAALLLALDVEPPKKLSVKKTAKKGEPVYVWAFAKSDPDFKALAAHEDETVRWACEARLGLKSTIKESRAQRFMSICRRFGRLPIALDYYGAATGRYSASSSARVNCQNLPSVRGSKDPDVGLLRKSMIAPKGKKVAVIDASQIEARIIAWLAGQADLVEAFAQGRDVYSEMATKIYGRPVDRKKNPEDYVPGFLGKCCTLGCGYQMSYFKFAQTVFGGMLGGPSILFDDAMADTLTVDVNRFARWASGKEDLTARIEETRPAALDQRTWITHLACAQRIIATYRDSNDAIVRYWATCGQMIDDMLNGVERQYGPVRTAKDKLILPNGMPILYVGLERGEDGDYSYLRRKEGRVQRVHTYGGSVAENISQALAGAYVKDAMVRMYLKYKLRTILQVHDEVVLMVDEETAQRDYDRALECMVTPPAWAVGLPLAAEGDIADSYGDAKG